MNYIKLFAQLLLLGLAFLTGLFFQKYRNNLEEIVRQQVEVQRLVDYSVELANLNQRNLELQNQIDSLSTESTRALNDALSENDRLAADLAVAERMRLKGTQCPRPDSGTDPASPGQPGDGAGVELGEETRRLVWDLRRELIQDQQDILYLREYVRRLQTTNPQ